MTASWTTVPIAGKDADVFDPGARPAFGLLFLHGAGLETLVDRPAFADPLAQLNVACVCPHGKRSWWVDRICPEFDADITPERYLLKHVVPFFDERWGLRPRSLAILGISMGGQGALRLAFRHPQIFPVAAGIASAIEFQELYNEGTAIDDMYDSKEQARQDTAVMQVQPFHYPPHIFFCIDPADTRWYRGNDRLHEKLTALGIVHTCDLTTEAGGHTWEYFNHMAGPALKFVHQGLQAESRRLL
jgi:pimeloyl-ACP methyl ester carboxylesterase